MCGAREAIPRSRKLGKLGKQWRATIQSLGKTGTRGPTPLRNGEMANLRGLPSPEDGLIDCVVLRIALHRSAVVRLRSPTNFESNLNLCPYGV